MVTKRAKAIVCNNFLLPGDSPNHCQSNLAFVRSHTSDISLAEVLHYSECKYQVNDTLQIFMVYFYTLAYASSMQSYGYPTQVWSCTQHSALEYVPVCNFVSRAVYTKATVDFGRLCGCIPVIVASSIEYNCY